MSEKEGGYVEMDGEDAMEECYKMKGKGHWEGGSEKAERKREIERSALKERGEQYHFLHESCLLGGLCMKLDTHLYLNTNLILPHNCPQAELIVVVLSHLLQILLT